MFSILLFIVSVDGIQSKRRHVGSATNKTVTRRNGDNLNDDNYGMSVVVAVQVVAVSASHRFVCRRSDLLPFCPVSM